MRLSLAFILCLALTAPVWALPLGTLLGPEPDSPRSQAERAYAQGHQALKQGDLVQAEAAFRQSMALDARLPHPLLGMADLAFKRKQADAAESWLRRALDLARQDAMVHTAWARYLFQQGRLEASRQAYLKAIELAPRAFQPRMDLADLYMRLQRPQQAIEQYRVAKSLRPDHAGVEYGLGMAHAALGKAGVAELAFKRATRLEPDNPLPLQALGRLYLADRRLNAAHEVLSRALHIRPEFVPAMLDLAEVALRRRQTLEAFRLLQQAERLAPTNAAVQQKLGMVWHALGELEKARAAYLRAIELQPDLHVALNNLAAISAQQRQNLDQALLWAQAAVKAEPNNPHYLDTLAGVLHARGETRQGVEILEKAVIRPDAPASIHLHLARLYLELGRGKEARSAAQHALALNPRLAPAREILAKTAGGQP